MDDNDRANNRDRAEVAARLFDSAYAYSYMRAFRDDVDQDVHDLGLPWLRHYRG